MLVVAILFVSFRGCVHSDRGAPFISRETTSFFATRCISFSTSTPYHPQGNSQCERSIQTIWRTIKRLLNSSVFLKTSGKQFCQKLSMLSGPLFVFQLMKLPTNTSCGSPERPWLVLRCLRGYCIQALLFYVATFETRSTPYATRLNSWRAIRRLLWYV